MTTTPKKQKTTNAATRPLYSTIDPAKFIIEPTLQGSGEGNKYAYVKLFDGRPVFQLAGVEEACRVPFGYDDGLKFSPPSKPSIKLEVSGKQLDFMKGIDEKVISTAIENKAEWFPSVKESPSDEAIRTGYSSRITEDETGKYKATLRVNLNLTDEAKKVKVSVTRRLASGKYEAIKPGSIDDVVAGCHVVPVLQTAGGVWVKHKSKKLSEHSLGLIFEAAELLVVKGVEGTGSTSFNLDGIEVAEEEEPAAAGDDAESQIEA